MGFAESMADIASSGVAAAAESHENSAAWEASEAAWTPSDDFTGSDYTASPTAPSMAEYALKALDSACEDLVSKVCEETLSEILKDSARRATESVAAFVSADTSDEDLPKNSRKGSPESNPASASPSEFLSNIANVAESAADAALKAFELVEHKDKASEAAKESSKEPVDISKMAEVRKVKNSDNSESTLYYATKEDLQKNQPTLRETATQAKKADGTLIERSVLSDMREHPPEVMSTKLTLTDKQGNTETEVVLRPDTPEAVSHKVSVNKKTNEVNYEIKEGNTSIAYRGVGDNLTTVAVDGRKLSGDEQTNSLKNGEILLSAMKKEMGSDLVKLPDILELDNKGFKDDEKPTGRLVLDNKEYQVKDGILTDGSRNLGKIDASGHVRLDGPPMVTLNPKGEQKFLFEGRDANDQPVVVKSENLKHQLTAEIKNPNGDVTHRISAGYLFDDKGALIGAVDERGNLKASKPETKWTHLNSKLEGSIVEGEVDGKPRHFKLDSSAPSGDIFLKNAATGKPEKHTINMGVLVNSSGDQVGLVKGPRLNNRQEIIGGSITFDSDPKNERPLASLKGAVFNLDIPGSNPIVLRGAVRNDQPALNADGKPNPSAIVDLNKLSKAVDSEHDKVAKLADHKITRFNRISKANIDEIVKEQRSKEQILVDIKNGDTSGLGKVQDLIQKKIEDAKLEKATPKEKALALAEKLATQKNLLEVAPTDVKKIDGSFAYKQQDEHGKVGSATVTIRAGELYTPDNKKMGDLVNKDGVVMISVRDQDPSKPAQLVKLSDLPGVQANLKFSDRVPPENVTWIGVPGGELRSIEQLKKQAEGERELYRLTHDETFRRSTGRYGSVEVNNWKNFDDGQYSKTIAQLDAIKQNGIASKEQFKLLDVTGISESFRPELAKQNAEASKKVIGAHPIETVEAAQKLTADIKFPDTGKVYHVDKGQLYEVKLVDGVREVDKNSCGEIGPGYLVTLRSGEQGKPEVFNLNEKRAVVDITFGDGKRQQLIGMGKPSLNFKGELQTNGLVPREDLERQAKDYIASTSKVIKEYDDKTNVINRATEDFSGFRNALVTQRDSVITDAKLLNRNLDNLFDFKPGIDSDSTNKFDNSVRFTQDLMKSMGVTTRTTELDAQGYEQARQQVAEGVVSGCITVASLGTSSALTFGASLLKAAEISKTTVALASLTGSVWAGGEISAALLSSKAMDADSARAKGQCEGAANSVSKFFEGVGALTAIKDTKLVIAAQKAGTELTEAQLAMTKTVVYDLLKKGVSDKVVYTLAAVSAVTDNALQVKLGTMAQEAATGKPSTSNEAFSTAMQMLTAKTSHGLIDAIPGSMTLVKNTLEQTTQGMKQALFAEGITGQLSSQREEQIGRLAQQLGLKESEIAGKLVNLDLGEAVSKAWEEAKFAGLTAAVLAPATHFIGRVPEHSLKKETTAPEYGEIKSIDSAALAKTIKAQEVKEAISNSAREQLQITASPESILRAGAAQDAVNSPTDVTTIIKPLSVEVNPESGSRFVSIGDGDKVELKQIGDWFFNRKPDADFTASDVKLHVSSSSPEDLAKLQAVLLPELINNPELSNIAKIWKTLDPMHAMHGLDSSLAVGDAPGSSPQKTKAFTFATDSAADAVVLAHKLDAILAKAGLNLDHPIESGNVDTTIGSGRVGIVRDRAEATRTEDGRLAAAVDRLVVNEITDRLGLPQGKKLTVEQLREIESSTGIRKDSLVYDTNQRLALVTASSFLDGGKLYLDEVKASKTPGDLTDRAAFYALSKIAADVDPSAATLGRHSLDGHSVTSPEFYQAKLEKLGTKEAQQTIERWLDSSDPNDFNNANKLFESGAITKRWMAENWGEKGSDLAVFAISESKPSEKQWLTEKILVDLEKQPKLQREFIERIATERRVDASPESIERYRRQNDLLEVIQEKFAPIPETDRRAHREAVKRDLQDIKAIGLDGEPTNAFRSLMSDTKLSNEQKDDILHVMALARQNWSSHRSDERMHPDCETNYLHTMAEMDRVLVAARRTGLDGDATYRALIASTISDSFKFSAPAPEGRLPNFHTHHEDAVLAARQILPQLGMSQKNQDRIIESILAHQVSPPEFMGNLYFYKISGVLEGKIKAGVYSTEEAESMRAVLKQMTVVGEDGLPRIRQLAQLNESPRMTNRDGLQEIAFTPEERKVFALSGTDRWVVPYDSAYDANFKNMSKEQQAEQLSRAKEAFAVIIGDSTNNYTDASGAAKIFSLRGVNTFFQDKTAYDSAQSIVTSYRDARSLLPEELRPLFDQSFAKLNEVIDPETGSLWKHVDGWLRDEKGLYSAKDHVPFFNAPFDYARPGENATADQIAKYQSNMKLAAEIRQEIVDYMRRLDSVSGELPGALKPVEFPERIAEEKFERALGTIENLLEVPETVSLRTLNKNNLADSLVPVDFKSLIDAQERKGLDASPDSVDSLGSDALSQIYAPGDYLSIRLDGKKVPAEFLKMQIPGMALLPEVELREITRLKFEYAGLSWPELKEVARDRGFLSGDSPALARSLQKEFTTSELMPHLVYVDMDNGKRMLVPLNQAAYHHEVRSARGKANDNPMSEINGSLPEEFSRFILPENSRNVGLQSFDPRADISKERQFSTGFYKVEDLARRLKSDSGFSLADCAVSDPLRRIRYNVPEIRDLRIVENHEIGHAVLNKYVVGKLARAFDAGVHLERLEGKLRTETSIRDYAHFGEEWKNTGEEFPVVAGEWLQSQLNKNVRQDASRAASNTEVSNTDVKILVAAITAEKRLADVLNPTTRRYSSLVGEPDFRQFHSLLIDNISSVKEILMEPVAKKILENIQRDDISIKEKALWISASEVLDSSILPTLQRVAGEMNLKELKESRLLERVNSYPSDTSSEFWLQISERLKSEAFGANATDASRRNVYGLLFGDSVPSNIRFDVIAQEYNQRAGTDGERFIYRLLTGSPAQVDCALKLFENGSVLERWKIEGAEVYGDLAQSAIGSTSSSERATLFQSMMRQSDDAPDIQRRLLDIAIANNFPEISPAAVERYSKQVEANALWDSLDKAVEVGSDSEISKLFLDIVTADLPLDRHKHPVLSADELIFESPKVLSDAIDKAALLGDENRLSNLVLERLSRTAIDAQKHSSLDSDFDLKGKPDIAETIVDSAAPVDSSEDHNRFEADVNSILQRPTAKAQESGRPGDALSFTSPLAKKAFLDSVELYGQGLDQFSDLQQMAITSPTNGLPNVLALADAIRQRAAQQASTPDAKPAELHVYELTSLKLVNDQHGHSVGDNFLLAGAHKLEEIFGKGNVYHVKGNMYASLGVSDNAPGVRPREFGHYSFHKDFGMIDTVVEGAIRTPFREVSIPITSDANLTDRQIGQKLATLFYALDRKPLLVPDNVKPYKIHTSDDFNLPQTESTIVGRFKELIDSASEISRKAFTDVSTGLLNKSAIQAAVGDYSQRHPQAVALSSDAIGLGGVNYIHGGEVGNKYIKEVADFYTRTINDLGIKGSLVSRYGGDEFIVLFKNQADCDRFEAVAKDFRVYVAKDGTVISRPRDLESFTEEFDGAIVSRIVSASTPLGSLNDFVDAKDMLKRAEETTDKVIGDLKLDLLKQNKRALRGSVPVVERGVDGKAVIVPMTNIVYVETHHDIGPSAAS